MILVAFASKHGSTHEVAEAIAATLGERGAQVELRPGRDVRGPVSDRELVVVGAPIYSGRWHRDAHRFLKRHRKELMRVPVAVFGMGPREPSEEAWQRSRRQLDRALAKRDWLRPVAVAVFGGVDPAPREGKPRRDLRDWDAIRAWASGIASDLGPSVDEGAEGRG
jgi:menaquinone-dependent protoporphyrinogen oxidase